jgi:hypothetical protein
VSRTRFAITAVLGVALAAVAGAQDRKFELRFKNEKGDPVPFYQEMTTEVAQHIKVQGQDLPQRQKSVFYYQWTPMKAETVKEGNEEVTKWTVKQKIEGLEMDIDISGNPIKYSSKNPDTSGAAGNPGLVEFFKNLKDSEFTATINTKNWKVEKVDGKEQFIAKLGAGSAQMDALLKKVMTEDALKEMTDPTFKLFPDAPKKKGDKWEKKSNLNLGPIGSYELIYKFTYAEPDKEGDKKDFDRIEVETVINYTAPKDPEGLLFRIKEGSKLVSDPAGSKGVVYYDPKNQRIPYAEVNIKLKGDLTVVIGGTDTKVELTQEQKTTIKTGDTSFYTPPAKVTPPGPTPPPPPKP